MGAWGLGPFDNDEAADWAYQVEACSDLACVRSKLLEVVEGEYLEAPLGEEGLAAAEVLSFCLSHGQSNITTSLSSWLFHLNDRPTDRDLQLGIETVNRVIGTQSELAETWEESTEGHSWRSQVESLRRRLEMTADRDLFLRFESLAPDLSRPHQVDWVAYFPRQTDAAAAADPLRSSGLEVATSGSDTEADWSVVASWTRANLLHGGHANDQSNTKYC